MKKLNGEATKLVIQFLILMQGLSDKDIRIPQHNTLRLKKGEAVHTDQGLGYLFSLGTLQSDGVGKYEYCMHFILVDKRSETGNRLDVLVFPVSSVDERNNVEEHGVLLEGGKVKSIILNFQRGLANQAYKWLIELKTSGYLKKPAKKK